MSMMTRAPVMNQGMALSSLQNTSGNSSLWLLAGTAAGAMLLAKKKADAECCGIVAYLGKDNKGGEVVWDGILIVQARGYDSAGVASIDENGELVLTKKATEGLEGGDCIKNLIREIDGKHDHNIVIAHTRWLVSNPQGYSW